MQSDTQILSSLRGLGVVRMLGPLVGALVVAALGQAILRGFGELSLDYQVLLTIALATEPESLTVESPQAQILRPFAWASAALALSVILVATLLVSLYGIHRVAHEYQVSWSRYLLPAVALATAGLAVWLGAFNTDKLALVERPMFSLLPLSTSQGIARPCVTYGMDVLAWWETLTLLAAFMALSTRAAGSADAVERRLVFRRRISTLLLYLGAVTLTIAVVQFDLLMRLPGNAARLDVADAAIAPLATGLAMYAGTYFTLVLAAMYVPVTISLRADAYALAAAKISMSTPEERDVWLRKRGLVGALSQNTARVVVVLGPLLAGWLGDPVARAFASLLGQ